MGLQVASVGGGTITLSNGQQVPISQAGLAGAQSAPTIPGPGLGPGGLGAGLGGMGGMGSTGLPPVDPTIQGVQGPAAPHPATTGGATNTGVDWAALARLGLGSNTTPTAQTAPTDYYAQYEQSLNASRANLEGQYVQAQHSIDQQQQLANATLATVPGKFATIAQQQEAGATRETGMLLKADTAAGMGGTKGSGGALANSQAEMSAAATQNAAGNKALVPDLGLGIQTQMAAERASLADAHSTAQGALDQAAMGVQASRASQSQSEAASASAQQTAHDNMVNDATTAYQRGLVIARINSGADLNKASTVVPGMTVGEEQKWTGTAQFQRGMSAINNGVKMDNGKTITDPKTVIALLKGTDANGKPLGGTAGSPLNPNVLAALEAYFPTYFNTAK